MYSKILYKTDYNMQLYPILTLISDDDVECGLCKVSRSRSSAIGSSTQRRFYYCLNFEGFRYQRPFIKRHWFGPFTMFKGKGFYNNIVSIKSYMVTSYGECWYNINTLGETAPSNDFFEIMCGVWLVKFDLCFYLKKKAQTPA